MEKQRMVVGVSGASGAPVAAELLRTLRRTGVETHLVVSAGGAATIAQESGMSLQEFCGLADRVYGNEEIGAAPASGSWKSMGMIVAPCSMKTAAGICTGYSDSLLLRAADVTLKERRRLVLLARECPLGTVHLRNLLELSKLGAVVLPPMLSFYHHPRSVEDCIRHVVGKLLSQFDLEDPDFRRWEGM